MEYFFKTLTNCETCSSKLDEHKLLGLRLNKSQGLRPKNKSGITVSFFQCKKCGLIFSNPQPIPKSLEQHYGTPAEDYWKPDYFKLKSDYFKKEIKIVNQLVSFKQRMKALDIGAGIGKALISLENNGWESYGIEPSKSFYDKAISEMNIDEKRLLNIGLEDAEYDENSFNFITFGAVFEHLFSPYEMLAKSVKWVSKGGIIHIEVPSSNWLISKIFNFYYKCIGTNFVTNLSPMHIPFHLFEFHTNSFIELSKRLNLSIEKIQYDVCSIPYIPKFFHPILKKIMKKTNSGM